MPRDSTGLALVLMIWGLDRIWVGTMEESISDFG
jgi:hypothetical protein